MLAYSARFGLPGTANPLATIGENPSSPRVDCGMFDDRSHVVKSHLLCRKCVPLYDTVRFSGGARQGRFARGPFPRQNAPRPPECPQAQAPARAGGTTIRRVPLANEKTFAPLHGTADCGGQNAEAEIIHAPQACSNSNGLGNLHHFSDWSPSDFPGSKNAARIGFSIRLLFRVIPKLTESRQFPRFSLVSMAARPVE